MKKIISILSILFLLTGCSCSKDVYKFKSVSWNINGETESYTCSRKDKEDASIKSMCEKFEDMTIELKDNGKIVVNFSSYNMKDEEAKYKIEDGYLYLEDDGEWMNFAKYNGDTIVITSGYAKVTLKK